MRLLDKIQPDAASQIEALRQERRAAAAGLQQELNRRVGDAAVKGVISPDDYQAIKQQVTAEHPVVGVNVTPDMLAGTTQTPPELPTAEQQ